MLLFNQLQTYLYLALVLFVIGLYGVLARRSLIAILISVELILNAASINFMAFNRFLAPHPAVGTGHHPVHHGRGRGRSRHRLEHYRGRVSETEIHQRRTRHRA